MIHDLYLVGIGIYSTLQFTTEATQTLERCRRAYCLLDEMRALEHIRALGPEVVDLLDLYDASRSRPEIYDQIAQTLTTAACSGVVPIALVTHGHPLFLVSASERVIAKAEEEGLSVGIISGVSSLDMLMSDLRLDFGYGFQAFDSTTLIAEDHPINTRLPTLVFQVANTMCLQPQFEIPNATIMIPLIEKLRRHYPPDHALTFVHSATQLLDGPSRHTVKLNDEIGLASVQLWKRPTIYIAPL